VWDVAITGGGVAGSSLAYCLAKRGLATALWDRATFPRPKVCGSGLLPQGVAALREMGLEPPSFPRISGFRLVGRRGTTVESVFRNGHGLTVRREQFDAWLLDRARAAGVTIHEGQPFPENVAARWRVAADGLHSRASRGVADRPLRMAFATRAQGIDLGDKVEIRFRGDGEIYLSPEGGGAANVVVLGLSRRFRGQRGEEIIARFLDGGVARIVEPVRGMGPLGVRVRDAVRGDLIMIGDAAGAPDPITGEGMSLALRSAIVASEAIVRGDVRPYAKWRAREGANARRLGRMFLMLSRVSDRAIGNLKRRPELLAKLMGLVAGEEAVSDIPWSTWFKLLLP
jgi:flavin-dependent dehydrogenase